MKGLIFGFALLLLVASTWAGTFSDNFDDENLDGWTLIRTPGPGDTWKIENGELVGQAVNAPIGSMIGEVTWKDYTVSVKVKITAHQPHVRFTEGAGIHTRWDSSLGGYIFALGTGGGFGNSKRLHAFYLNLKESDVPQHYQHSPFDWKLDTWYEVKVTAERDQFKVYVDDELVLDYVEATFRAGQVGLSVGFLGTTVHFDDFSVTGDDVPDTVMSVDPKAKLATTWAAVKNGK